MITLTTEQAQQIEEALKEVRFAAIERCDSVIPSCDKALATIRAARSQEQEPVAANCPKCKSEISHWSWCPDFVQPVSQKQEPVAWGRIFDGDIIDCICPEEHALNEGDYTVPLYAAPVRTKDLTDIEYLQDAVTKALKKAFHLGQTYWQQADSESYAANKKADVTQELFFKLKDDTRAVIAKFKEKNK